MTTYPARTRYIFATCIGLWLAGPAASADLPQPSTRGPVVDIAGILSAEAKADINNAAETFRTSSGRRIVILVFPKGRVSDHSMAVQQKWDATIGVVYVTSPDDTAGRLLIVDPTWRKTLPAQWEFMFPQRLAQKYGDEPFERRVVLSAQYLAKVFPDKLAFVLKPRGGKLSPGSVRFSRASYIGLELLGYFIIIFTAFRTFWPARLRDEDQDDFSNELRRLKKERQIW